MSSDKETEGIIVSLVVAYKLVMFNLMVVKFCLKVYFYKSEYYSAYQQQTHDNFAYIALIQDNVFFRINVSFVLFLLTEYESFT